MRPEVLHALESRAVTRSRPKSSASFAAMPLSLSRECEWCR